MKTQYEVEMFGQAFTVTSEKGLEHIQAIEAAADRRIRDIEIETKTIVPVRIALMALLQAEAELIEAIGKRI